MDENLYKAGNNSALMCHVYQQGKPVILASCRSFLASSSNPLKCNWGIYP